MAQTMSQRTLVSCGCVNWTARPCRIRQHARALLRPSASLPSGRGPAPARLGAQLASRQRGHALQSLTYGAVEDVALSPDSYITIGLSHCFERDEDGKLADRYLIEPLAANSLECMVTGAKTSFLHVYGLTVGEALSRNKDILPKEFAEGRWCSDYEFRVNCSARTWLRPHAQDALLDIVPLGKMRSNFNINLDSKRVLNMENVVNDDDNIKQDISIDVYGRKDKEEAEAAAAATAAPKQAAEAEEEEDELDSLLAA